MTMQSRPGRLTEMGRWLVAAGYLLGCVALGVHGARSARPAPHASTEALASLDLSQLQERFGRKADVPTAELLMQRLVQAGRADEAVRVGEQALLTFPDNSALLNALGIANGQLGKVTEAREMFERAIRSNPRSVAPYLNLGHLATQLGDHTRALAEYDRASVVDPTSPAVWLGVGEAAAQLQRPGDAREAFRKGLAQAPEDGALHEALGNFLAEQGSAEEADRHLQKALASGRRTGRLYASLAMAYADRAESEEMLARALECAAEAERLGDQSSLLLYARGLALQRRRRYPEAIRSYERLISQSTSASGAWIGLSQCLRALGRPEEADRAARTGERILNDRQKVSHLRHQIRSNPANMDLRDEFARVLLEQKHYLLAADQLRYIAQHRPERPQEWLRVAKALELGGRKELAAYLRRYLKELSPGAPGPVLPGFESDAPER